jgi:hypothetical protein
MFYLLCFVASTGLNIDGSEGDLLVKLRNPLPSKGENNHLKNSMIFQLKYNLL